MEERGVQQVDSFEGKYIPGTASLIAEVDSKRTVYFSNLFHNREDFSCLERRKNTYWIFEKCGSIW